MVCTAALVAVALAAPVAFAAEATAINNATVQPAGPRSGTNGKAFFNVEGRNVPNSAVNASYGVLEFDATDLGFTTNVSKVASVILRMTQTMAGFTSRGRMQFFVTTDNTTSIEPDAVNPECIFDFADVHGLNGQFATIYDLGEKEFLPVRSGTLDNFAFQIPPGAMELYLRGQINSGGIIRFIVAPEESVQDDELVAGTYAGYTNTGTNYAPRLTVRARLAP
jgi:hypothetical protein